MKINFESYQKLSDFLMREYCNLQSMNMQEIVLIL